MTSPDLPAPTPTDARLANLVAALATDLADRVREATETAAGHRSAAPAALVALHEFLDNATMDQLRAAVGLTPSGAVRLVDRLAQQGYVERRAGTDARSVALVLTPSGREAAVGVMAARTEAVATVISKLSSDERKTLTDVAENLLRIVTEQRLVARDGGVRPTGGWLCRLCDTEACGRARGDCPAADAATNHLSATV
ncbi:MAG TPA: MarR family winged helix-turn-helix transcriptional regulator [Acidimicrobiales bacterium]|jgi:DNA-binding MarR family transcriptional regulator